MKKKNPAAVALGRKGGKQRLKTLTPERRSEIARHANAVRYGKAPAKPTRWYGLLLLPTNYEWRGVADAAKVLDAAHANPEVVYWSLNKAEVVKKAARYRTRVATVVEQAVGGQA
jgi:hypothetical protein